MQLTSKQTSYLRSLAHKLSPAVQLGKAGLTAAIMKEIDRNLSDHELIKIRIGGDDREDLRETAATITADTKSALVQIIGYIAVIYRPAEDPVIELPKPKSGSKAPAKKSAPKVVRAKS